LQRLRCLPQSDGATAAVTLKLMSRDIEKNGSNGGAMSIDEAIGERLPARLLQMSKQSVSEYPDDAQV